MNLQEKIAADLKAAMLAKDSRTVDTLRLLRSELIYAATAAGATPTDDEGVLQIIRREIKKRKEAADLLRESSPERAAAEEAEVEILRRYLPPEIKAEEIEAFVREFLNNNPEKASQKGITIKETLSRFHGAADGKLVSEIVARLTA